MKRKSTAIRLRTRIFMILVPTIYSTWFAISSMCAINDDSARNTMIFSHRSFAQDSSRHYVKEMPRLASDSTISSAYSNCFEFNSEAWLRGPRLANANNSSGIDFRFAKEIMLASVHWSAGDNLLLEQSICERKSRFVRTKPTGNIETELRIWVVRLIYMYLQFHQHRHAFQEAQSLNPQCIHEREAAGIGPFDFECPNAKFLVVRFYNNGIGANMRYSAVPSLMAGLATDRVVLFVNNSPVGPTFLQQPWTQVTCERRDAQCFFLPASPCVLTHEEIENAYSLQKKERRKLFRTGTLPEDRNDDRVLLLQLPFRAQRIPENLRGNLYNNTLPLIHNMKEPVLQRTLLEAADLILKNDSPVGNQSFSYYGMDSPLYHAMLLYSLRPNPRAVNRMDEILNTVIPSEFESNESMGLPIRGKFLCSLLSFSHVVVLQSMIKTASDKCDVEMECMSFQNHLQAAEESWQTMNVSSDQEPFIVITTESKKIKEEMESLRRTNATDFAPTLVVNHLDITQDTGYFEPLSNDNTTGDHTDGAILSAMSSLKLQLLPRLTLGNCCSSFHLMLKDILSEGCGAHHDHVFQCLQGHANPKFRTCCSWDKSPGCIARRVQLHVSDIEAS